MKKYILFLSLSLGLVLLLIQSAFFIRTASTAGSSPKQTTRRLARLSPQTTVAAEGQVNLRGRALLTSYLGSSNAQRYLEQNLARSTVLASADFDGDGTADLIASLDGPGFVDAILATINNDSGVNLSSQRSVLLDLFNQGGRGAVLYRLADDNATNPVNNRAFIDAEYNRAFVLTQYFGYLRRSPDIGGFLFWLGQVNSVPLRSLEKQRAMVCSFITSLSISNGSALWRRITTLSASNKTLRKGSKLKYFVSLAH